MTEKIPVFLINWNAIEVTRKCIASILQYTDRKKILILVTDNGSDVKDQEELIALKSEGKIDELFLNEKNIGFPAAFNHAFENTKGSIFCSVNNDCLVESEWLEKGIQTLASAEDVAAVCSNVYEDLKKPFVVEDRFLSQLYGPIMFFRRKAWDSVGPFDAQNFSPGFGEELDWSYRALRKGWRLKFAGQSLAYHVCSYSSKKNLGEANLKLLRLTNRIQVRLYNWSFYRLFFSPRTWYFCYLPELKQEIRAGNIPILWRAFKKNSTNWKRIFQERARRRLAV